MSDGRSYGSGSYNGDPSRSYTDNLRIHEEQEASRRAQEESKRRSDQYYRDQQQRQQQSNSYNQPYRYGSTGTSNQGSSGNSGCFIATAAYGSPLAAEVMLLRRFRDEVLLTSKPGSRFVRAYYVLSPPIARFIARHKPLRSATRNIFLGPLLKLIKAFREK